MVELPTEYWKYQTEKWMESLPLLHTCLALFHPTEWLLYGLSIVQWHVKIYLKSFVAPQDGQYVPPLQVCHVWFWIYF